MHVELLTTHINLNYNKTYYTGSLRGNLIKGIIFQLHGQYHLHGKTAVMLSSPYQVAELGIVHSSIHGAQLTKYLGQPFLNIRNDIIFSADQATFNYICWSYL